MIHSIRDITEVMTGYPRFIKSPEYEVIMGSMAYGVNTDNSDIDIYGFVIPPKDIVFPHLAGYIYEFDNSPNTFKQFQQHHIQFKEKEYDIQMFNIVKFFRLAMNNTPNIIDSLYVPSNCILTSSKIGDRIRGNRNIFLSKKLYHTFTGYAVSQYHKIINKNPKGLEQITKFENKYNISHEIKLKDVETEITYRIQFAGNTTDTDCGRLNWVTLMEYQTLFSNMGKRAHIVKEKHFDVKFGYHIVRLLDEADQLLSDGTMLLGRNRDQMKAIRNGEVTLDQLKELMDIKLLGIEKLYNTSNAIPHKPDVVKIKRLLLSVLEEKYGSLDATIKHSNSDLLIKQIKDILL